MSHGLKNKSAEEERDKLRDKIPRLWVRARVVQALRRFFIDQDYLEVETPYLIPSPIPELHIDPIAAGHGYLITSPEICMKRLVAAGCMKVFQICRCFREGERGALHLPEFTMLEWYRTQCTYFSLMEECERLFLELLTELGMGEEICFQAQNISFRPPWERITVSHAFEKYASLPMQKAVDTGCFDEILVRDIEPMLGITRPTFLYAYPATQAALARLHPENPALAERFELYVGGLELGNAFSELRDPTEQTLRFEKDTVERKRLGKESYPLPAAFLRSLKYLPDSSGIALGVDRLVMLLSDGATMDEVVAFAPEDL
jgi:lysyl-tRNA synthetase class 2